MNWQPLQGVLARRDRLAQAQSFVAIRKDLLEARRVLHSPLQAFLCSVSLYIQKYKLVVSSESGKLKLRSSFLAKTSVNEGAKIIIIIEAYSKFQEGSKEVFGPFCETVENFE